MGAQKCRPLNCVALLGLLINGLERGADIRLSIEKYYHKKNFIMTRFSNLPLKKDNTLKVWIFPMGY